MRWNNITAHNKRQSLLWLPRTMIWTLLAMSCLHVLETGIGHRTAPEVIVYHCVNSRRPRRVLFNVVWCHRRPWQEPKVAAAAAAAAAVRCRCDFTILCHAPTVNLLDKWVAYVHNHFQRSQQINNIIFTRIVTEGFRFLKIMTWLRLNWCFQLTVYCLVKFNNPKSR